MNISKLVNSPESMVAEIERLAKLIMDKERDMDSRMYYFGKFDLISSIMIERHTQSAPIKLITKISLLDDLPEPSK